MPAKHSKNSRNPEPDQTPTPTRLKLNGDCGPLWLFRIEWIKGKPTKVANRFPSPVPYPVLLRVFGVKQGEETQKFKTLVKLLREIEDGGGNLRLFLLAARFLAQLSLKKTGKKFRQVDFKEMEKLVSKLAMLSGVTEEIRRSAVFLDLPQETADERRQFCHDVILHSPEVFDAYRRGTEVFLQNQKKAVHPSREVNDRLLQVEKSLRPLRSRDAEIYNSRWALTEKVIAAFGGSMSRKALEQRTTRNVSFLPQQKSS